MTDLLKQMAEALRLASEYAVDEDWGRVNGCINLALTKLDAQAAEQAAGVGWQSPELPQFIRSEVERAIAKAVSPTGMSTHNGMALIGHDKLRYLLALIDKQAAPVQQVGELFAYVHKRGTEEEEFIHAVAVNGNCADCEPLFLGAALSTRPELRRLAAEVEALRADAGRYRAVRDDDCHPYGICIWDEDDGWAQDARKPDVVDAAIDAALAAWGEKR